MKKYAFSLLVIIFFAAGAVYAYENRESVPEPIRDITFEEDKLIEAAEDSVSFSDLGVENPGVLPTSPLYFFKELGRAFKKIFIFNPVAKAELELQIANQKAAELKKVEELQPQNAEAIKKALSNYQKSQERLKTRFESLQKTSQNPNVERLLEKAIIRTIQHEKLFAEIAEKNAVFKNIRLPDMGPINIVLPEKRQETVCTEEYNPVCGTDDKTYSNACHAVVAGARIKHKGECGKEEGMTGEDLEAYNKKLNDFKTCGIRPGAPGDWVCKDGGWKLKKTCDPAGAISDNMECEDGVWRYRAPSRSWPPDIQLPPPGMPQ